MTYRKCTGRRRDDLSLVGKGHNELSNLKSMGYSEFCLCDNSSQAGSPSDQRTVHPSPSIPLRDRLPNRPQWREPDEALASRCKIAGLTTSLLLQGRRHGEKYARY